MSAYWPPQPDLRGVTSEALKAEHEKKYNAEYDKWLKRKKYYDETEYPAYKAERLRRAAAAKQRECAPEVAGEWGEWCSPPGGEDRGAF